MRIRGTISGIFAVRESIRPGWATKLYIFDLVAMITVTLVDYPANRPGWVSPLGLAWSVWLVSMFCRWPIPEAPCDDLCGGECWEES
jgi:hypothetical protein